MKIRNWMLVVNAVLGAIIALAPFKLFPVCTAMAKDGNPMKCYYSGWLFVALGSFIVVISLLALLVRHKRGLVSFTFLLTALSAAACWIIPKGLIKLGDRAEMGWECGLCRMDSMSCHTVTMPVITKIVIVLVVLNVLMLLYGLVAEKR